MNPAMPKQLLAIATGAECLAGLAFMLAPGMTIALIFGVEQHGDGVMIARVAGVALLSLGIACWGARADAGGAARTGTLRAITLYNIGAGLFLVVFAASGRAGGLAIWIVGILHLGLGAAFALSMRSVRNDA